MGEGDSLDTMLRENEGGLLDPDPYVFEFDHGGHLVSDSDICELGELSRQSVDRALNIKSAAVLLETDVETLLDLMYRPIWVSVRGLSISGLKRMAGACLILALEKSREEKEREGEVNNAD